jgi:hypothetical protein
VITSAICASYNRQQSAAALHMWGAARKVNKSGRPKILPKPAANNTLLTGFFSSTPPSTPPAQAHGASGSGNSQEHLGSADDTPLSASPSSPAATAASASPSGHSGVCSCSRVPYSDWGGTQMLDYPTMAHDQVPQGLLVCSPVLMLMETCIESVVTLVYTARLAWHGTHLCHMCSHKVSLPEISRAPTSLAFTAQQVCSMAQHCNTW